MANRPGLIIVSGRARQISDADVLGAGGLDRITSGILKIGDATATDVALGRASGTVTIYGAVTGNVGFVQAANHTIAVNPSLSAGVAGGDMSLLAGTGNTTGAGGTLTLAAGDGGASSGAGGLAELKGGDGGVTNGAGGDVEISGGVGKGTGVGGDVYVRGGTATGVAGYVRIGDTNTTSVYLGAAAIDTKVAGPLTVYGDTTVGDAITDSVTFNAAVVTDLTFRKELAHTISVQTSTNMVAGGALTVRAGNGWQAAGGALLLAAGEGNASPGGSATLQGGAAPANYGGDAIVRGGSGYGNGNVLIGTTQTAAITIGATGLTTTVNGTAVFYRIGSALTPTINNTYDLGDGPNVLRWKKLWVVDVDISGTLTLASLTLSGDLTVQGNTYLGNASTDTVVYTARVASAVVPSTNNAYDLGDGPNVLRWKKLWTVDADISGTLTLASLTLSGDLTVQGNTYLGNASTDTISLTGQVNTDLIFQQNYGGNRYIKPAPTTGHSGDILYIEGGPSTDSPGGGLLLAGGSGVGTGTGVLVVGGLGVAGPVVVGFSSTYTTTIDIGGSGITTTLYGSPVNVSGSLTITSDLTVNGNTTLGSDSADTITFNGYIDSASVYFTNTGNHNLRVANVASGTGRSLSVLAGGSSSGASGWLYLSGGTSTSDGGGVEIIGCASGSSGAVNIGTMYTTLVTIGASGIGTTVAGGLTTLGDVTLGDNAADQITFNGYINSDIVFRNAGASRTVRMDAAASGTGNDLTVQAQGTLSGAGGWLYLFGGVGTSSGSGVSVDSSSASPGGTVRIGTSYGVGYTTSVIIGKDGTSVTTINGTTINIGIISPTAVNIGVAGVTTTIYGTLSLSNALAITSGGTGATTKSSAFDNLAPSTSIGDLIVYDGIDNVRLGVSSTSGYVLSADTTASVRIAYLDPQPTYATPPGLCLANLTTTITMVNARLAFVYLGRVQRTISSVTLAYNVTTAQSGGTARLAVFTSPDPPAFQSTNPLTYRGEVDSYLTWTSTGRKTSAISVSGCTPGLHLWIGWFCANSPSVLPAFRAAQTDDAWSGIVQYKDGTAPSLWVAGSYPTASLYNVNPPWFVAEFNQP